MSQTNPLSKYHRQPKIYITLPSKGLYYPPGVLIGDYNQVPIYALSGMDDIILKTPDALFSGKATTTVIESCCPYIKDAQKIPAIDVDALIIAIRIASYGDKLSVDKVCKNCGADNTYEISLPPILDKLNNLKFQNTIQLNDDVQIKLRPLNYFEMSHYSVENFKLQKILSQINDLADDEKQAKIDEIFKDLADLNLDLFVTMIEHVSIPEQIVTNKEHISDWLKNSERSLFQQIKTKIESNRAEWSIPNQPISCSSCSTNDEIELVLDYSSFFV